MLLLLLLFLPLLSQSQQLSGRVIDTESGEPLPYVNIYTQSKDSTQLQGGTADWDGNFQLQAGYNAHTIHFSHIGFKTLVLRVDQMRPNMRIELKENAVILLNHLDINVYAPIRIDYPCTCAPNPHPPTIEYNSLDFAKHLAGRVPGLQVTRASSNIASSTFLHFRGLSSLSQDNQPLILVDDLPLSTQGFHHMENSLIDYGSALVDINPEDIEHIQVYANKVSNVLYGHRAAKGIINLQTKKRPYNNRGNAFTLRNHLSFTPLRDSLVQNSFLQQNQLTWANISKKGRIRASFQQSQVKDLGLGSRAARYGLSLGGQYNFGEKFLLKGYANYLYAQAKDRTDFSEVTTLNTNQDNKHRGLYNLNLTYQHNEDLKLRFFTGLEAFSIRRQNELNTQSINYLQVNNKADLTWSNIIKNKPWNLILVFGMDYQHERYTVEKDIEYQQNNPLLGQFSLAQFNYKEALYLLVSQRNDWASGNFLPHYGAELRLFVEELYKKPKWVDRTSLLARFTSIEQQGDPYRLLQSPILLNNGQLPTRITERHNNVETGIQLGFFKRLELGLMAYRNLSQQQNDINIENRGLELNLKTKIIKHRNGLNAQVFANASWNQNRLSGLAAGKSLVHTTLEVGDQRLYYLLREGGSLGELYSSEQGPSLGQALPQFTLGFGTDWRYRNWSLGLMMDWRTGSRVVSTAASQQAEQLVAYSANYLKFRQAYLGYELRDKKFLGQNFSKISLRFYAQNFALLGTARDADPELLALGQNSLLFGLEQRANPLAPQLGFSLGVEL